MLSPNYSNYKNKNISDSPLSPTFRTGLNLSYTSPHVEISGNSDLKADNPEILSLKSHKISPAYNLQNNETTIKELQAMTGLSYSMVLKRVHILEPYRLFRVVKGKRPFKISYHMPTSDLIKLVRGLEISHPYKSTILVKYIRTFRTVDRPNTGEDYNRYYADQFTTWHTWNEETQDKIFRYYTRWLNRKNDPEYISYGIVTSNRFNSPSIAKKQLAAAESKFTEYCNQHDTALLVTPTTDPSKFKSLKDSVSHIGPAWNIFHKKLKRELKKKGKDTILRFIKCLEFTKTGLPHYHIIIFGISFLHANWVRYVWSKLCRQGERVHLCTLAIRDGNLYWKQKPSGEEFEDISNHTPKSYLLKNLNQLIKNPYKPELVGYWLFQQRIITHSRS